MQKLLYNLPETRGRHQRRISLHNVSSAINIPPPVIFITNTNVLLSHFVRFSFLFFVFYFNIAFQLLFFFISFRFYFPVSFFVLSFITSFSLSHSFILPFFCFVHFTINVKICHGYLIPFFSLFVVIIIVVAVSKYITINTDKLIPLLAHNSLYTM